jgi:RHS repeat-associated protein
MADRRSLLASPLIDASHNVTTWAYDADNRMVSETNPLGHLTTWLYDADGNLTESIDRDGRMITYSYDADSRVTSETWFDSSHHITNIITNTYDADGNLLTASNFAGTVTYGYDADNRVTFEAVPSGLSMTFVYDADGEVTETLDSQGGITTSIYNADGLLQTREQGGAGVTPLRIDFTYTPDNQIATETRYSDLAGTTRVGFTTKAYDADGMVTSILDQDGSGNTLQSITYLYDADGWVTEDIEPGRTVTYAYDAAGEVTEAITNGTPMTYSYDATGNQTSNGQQVGPDNQITSDGVWTYTYDAEGNLIEKSKGANAETILYSYDDENHLVSEQDYATPNGTLLSSESMVYDAEGNRVVVNTFSNVSGSTSSQYAYLPSGIDGGNLYAVSDNTGTVQSRYVYGDQQNRVLASNAVSNGPSWLLTDHLGSVRVATNASGTGVDDINYDAYGNITSQTNSSAMGLIGYTGAQFDSVTGLVYDNARYYDPTQGRWLSQDPSSFDAGDVNLYRYTGNDPVNATDPTGKEIFLPDNRRQAENVAQKFHEEISSYFLAQRGNTSELPNFMATRRGYDFVREYRLAPKPTDFTLAGAAGRDRGSDNEVLLTLGKAGRVNVQQLTGGSRLLDLANYVADQFEQGLKGLTEPLTGVYEKIKKLSTFDTKDFRIPITEIISNVVKDPIKFITNLFEGAKIGFEKFFPENLQGLTERLTKYLGDWLFSNAALPNFKLPNPFPTTVEGVAGVGVDFLSKVLHLDALTPDFLKEVLSTVSGFDVDSLIDHVGRVKEFFEGGINHLLEEVSKLPDLASSTLSSLTGPALDYLKVEVVKQAAIAAAEALFPGGAGAALRILKTGYAGVSFLLDNAERLKATVVQVFGLIRLLERGNPEEIGPKIFKILDSSVVPLLDLGGKLIGIHSFKAKAKELLDQLDIRPYIVKGAQLLYEKTLKPLIDKVLETFGLRGQPLTDEVRVGDPFELEDYFNTNSVKQQERVGGKLRIGKLLINGHTLLSTVFEDQWARKGSGTLVNSIRGLINTIEETDSERIRNALKAYTDELEKPAGTSVAAIARRKEKLDELNKAKREAKQQANLDLEKLKTSLNLLLGELNAAGFKTANLTVAQQKANFEAFIKKDTRLILAPYTKYTLSNYPGRAANGAVYTTDSLGRIAEVDFVVQQIKPSGMREDPKSELGAALGGVATDVAFHLLGDQFYGSPYYPNIIPGDGTFNHFALPVPDDVIDLRTQVQEYERATSPGSRRTTKTPGTYGLLEAIWRVAALEHQTVVIHEQLAYTTSNVRPSTFSIGVVIDGKATKIPLLRNSPNGELDKDTLNRLLGTVKEYS